MLKALRKRMKGQKGFTLVELLVVIIIIAILSAIAIPTYLGQRSKAQDTASKSLIRNSMTAIESSYVDNQTFAPATMTAAVLQAIEPSITFVAAANAAAAYGTATATTALNTVNYFGDNTSYQVGSKSNSGTVWGVDVNKSSGNDAVGNGPGTSYYKANVKLTGTW